ncbi:MAG: sulfatase, partial [Bacteroidetes bacterium]|nr:sulfatase [Bacteroidota bacterium]
STKIKEQENEEKQRPNILYISIDDPHPDLGCYGSTYIKTPNIDKLARSGVAFNNAYCQQAVSNPSRASIMTGLRPDSTRVWDLYTKLRDNLPDVVTMPQYFMKNGYRTAAIGKIYHNNIPDTLSWSEPKLYIDGFPFDPDAVYLNEENLQLVEEKKKRLVDEGKQERYIDQFGKWYIKTVATECTEKDEDGYFDSRQTDVAIAKLKEYKNMDKPFFFGVGYYRPHLPFNAPKKYWDLYERDSIPLANNPFLPENMPKMAMNNMLELLRYDDMLGMPNSFEGQIPEAKQRELIHGYYASVSYIDAQVGRLMDALDELGLAENTIVVLWSDHGWKLGEHNGWSKMTNYELDTRIPLIVRAPEFQGNGSSTDAFVELVDIFPALCDLCGLDTPNNLHGTSFKPILENPDMEWKSAAFSQYLRGRYHPAEGEKEYMGYAMRTRQYKYVEWYEWDPGNNIPLDLIDTELYDYQSDPGENTNVAGNRENINVVDELSKQLKAGWRAAKPIVKE